MMFKVNNSQQERLLSCCFFDHVSSNVSSISCDYYTADVFPLCPFPSTCVTPGISRHTHSFIVMMFKVNSSHHERLLSRGLFDYVSSNTNSIKLWLLLCFLCVPLHQLASPPGFHVTHIPEGNLVYTLTLWLIAAWLCYYGEGWSIIVWIAPWSTTVGQLLHTFDIEDKSWKLQEEVIILEHGNALY